ncbi:MAG: hypothetical protein AAB470_02185 [Patescibacteria group bacterium]
MKSSLLLFCIFTFFLFTSITSAQVPISVGGLELTASSDNPVPGQTVTITARSYIVDINTAKISWIINGKTEQNATGATTLKVVAPDLGKKLNVDVSATTPEGRNIKASIVVGSGSIDIIVETSGYTHPFFKGKIPPVYQNTVKIVAIPHIANSSGVEYDPKNLVYQWKKNDRVIEDQSGYGKQALILTGEIVPRPYDISVTAWPRDIEARAQGYINIAVGGPSINFYINDPLYGPLFNRVIGDVIRIGSQKETGVLAVPFGFDKPVNGIGNLTYSWLINGLQDSGLSKNESLVLRAPDNSSGSSNIQLDIRNPDKILQGESGGFSASFSADKSVLDNTGSSVF